MVNDYNLNEFKCYLLETFKAFIEFCQQHGLTYYAAFHRRLTTDEILRIRLNK